jgi:hypothetical protein
MKKPAGLRRRVVAGTTLFNPAGISPLEEPLSLLVVVGWTILVRIGNARCSGVGAVMSHG